MKYCPNPLCILHNPKMIKNNKWYCKHGFYSNKQHKKTRRYKCLNCGTTFSDRTEEKDWYLHRNDININDVEQFYKCGVSISEISEIYNCSTQLIRTRLKRNNQPTIYYKHPQQRLEKILS